MTIAADEVGGFRKIWDLYKYSWRTSGRAQIVLSALSVGLFLLELAPLELQRRIVNTAVEKRAYLTIAMLCGIYLIVALVQGGLKLVLNVYRGSVIETVSKKLRLDPNLMASPAPGRRAAKIRASQYPSLPPKWMR